MKIFSQIILMLMLQIAFSNAQSAEQNLQKYWFYRDRLTKCFVYVGDGPGESLVAAGRGTSGDNGWGNIALDYGEDQTIHLGWYIATLATEYALEDAYNLDKEQTKKELYFAMQAFNRIDYDAEWYYRGTIAGDDDNNGYSDDLNGFFSRNDLGYSYYDPNPYAPLNPNGTQFIANHSWQYLSIPGYSLLDVAANWAVKSWHLNATDPIYNEFVPDVISPSDYQLKSTDHLYSFEMSKDQVNVMLLGLALVKKCVDPNEYYVDGSGTRVFMDNETSFVQEAKNIAERLWNSWDGWGDNDLCIENPVTGHTVVCCEGNDHGCGIGAPGGILGAEYGYAMAINFITDLGIDHYLTIAGQAVGFETWNVPDILFQFGDDPLFKWSLLVSIGHSSFATALGIPVYNNSQAQLCSAVQQPGIFGGYFDSPILPLIHAYLHDETLNCFDQSYYDDLIDQAPCQGPYNFSNQDFDYANKTTCKCTDLAGTNGGYWSSPNTFHKPEEREANMEEDKKNKTNAEFNGLDYMLLYNLYYLYYGFPAQWEIGSYNPLVYSDQIEYTNVNNYVEKYDYPRQDYVDLGPGNASYTVDIGTNEHPKVVSAFHTITSDKVIGTGGNVTYKFGDIDGFIDLANFDAVNADFFEMIQDPLTCNTTSNVYEKHASSSISNFHSSGYTPFSLIKPPTVDSIILFQNIKLHPNPASNSVTISTGDNQTYKLVMADMYGKQVKEISFNGPDYQMNLSSITAGVYMVQVSNNSGQKIGQSKLIVQ